MQKSNFLVYSTSNYLGLQSSASDSTVLINRASGSITVEPKQTFPHATPIECYGFLGISHFSASKYLIAISQAQTVGRIKDCFIYQIKEIDFIPYRLSMDDLPECKEDKSFMKMLHSVIHTNSFYFSYNYDITDTIQKISNFSEHEKSLSPWERAEKRFFWNYSMCQDFIQAGVYELILPIINGFVRMETVNYKGNSLDYALISRRDHRRNGTRFNTRGLDSAGNAVNFVETEQIIGLWKDRDFILCSYVQTRGSIPMLWSQKPNLAWSPKPRINGSVQQNEESSGLHLTELMEKYGGVTLVNLIDKKGSQKAIGTAFTDLYHVHSNEKLNYEWFDFHAECKKMKYENIARLLHSVEKKIEIYGYCQVSTGENDYMIHSQVYRKQTGIFRTNCMDCLDRTNVVQSVFARNSLHSQLNGLGIGEKPNGQAFQAFPEELEKCFRECWVQNADRLSILYSGTPAQKTDFTRTGKRTIKGALDDGKYSLQRFVINNFLDGANQNSWDSFLGKITPKKAKEKMQWKYMTLMKFLVILMALIWLSIWTAKHSAGDFAFWFIFIFCFGLSLKMLKSSGSKLVDKPIINT